MKIIPTKSKSRPEEKTKSDVLRKKLNDSVKSECFTFLEKNPKATIQDLLSHIQEMGD